MGEKKKNKNNSIENVLLGYLASKHHNKNSFTTVKKFIPEESSWLENYFSDFFPLLCSVSQRAISTKHKGIFCVTFLHKFSRSHTIFDIVHKFWRESKRIFHQQFVRERIRDEMQGKYLSKYVNGKYVRKRVEIWNFIFPWMFRSSISTVRKI